MKWFFIALAVFSLLHATTKADKKIVCYWASWAFYRTGSGNHRVSNINPALCTHFIYTFTGLDLDGKIFSLDPNLDLTNKGFKTFIDLKNKPAGKGAKIILAIGGWNEGSVKYSVMSHSESSRKTFVDSILRFITFHGFDGIDIDWEYPTQRGGIDNDRESFVELIKDLKNTLSPWGLSVSLAVSGSRDVFNQAYNMAEICDYADFVSIMGYDLQSQEVTSHHADLSDIKPIIETIKKSNKNCLQKVILGVPTYGRSYTLKNPLNSGVNAPTSGVGRPGDYTKEPGFLGYNEICELKKTHNAKPVYNGDKSTVYMTYGDQWISYEDKNTALKKINYVKEQGLGGMMIWTLDTDDFRNKCFEGAYPILRTIHENLI